MTLIAELSASPKSDTPRSETQAPTPAPGSKLRETIFDPLLRTLGGRTRLLLAPDGELTRLPFEVLPSDPVGGRLIDTYQISYLNTGRDVLRFGLATTVQPTDAVVAGDPDFDLAQQVSSAPAPATASARRSRDFDRTKYHFDRLPGTRIEAERIAALLGVQPWLEHDVLKGRLKQDCRSPRILHLATHGFFLQDQPHDPNRGGSDLGVIGGEPDGSGRLSGPLPENPLLRAGLALAGANTWLQEKPLPPEAEDGLLTAEDVSGLDLLATELVVLSACETGLGEVRTGEGVFGLQRAFVLAGAKTLVMSLWSVPDEPTRELMEDFYQRLLAGQPRAEALREAQRKLKSHYPDPYFWGAFICQGDPGSPA
jgi:CHAT domain-containing protein